MAQRPGDLLEVEIFDPFHPFQMTEQDGYRPISVTVKPISGTLTQKDVPIWIVQRLRYAFGSGRDRVRYHRFVLPAGASSATAQFAAISFFDPYWEETLHLELDGDLVYRQVNKLDFARLESSRRESKPGVLPRILWLTATPGVVDSDRVRRLLIDFSFNKYEGQFEQDLPSLQPAPVAGELGQLTELRSVLEEAYGQEFIKENANKFAGQGTAPTPHTDWSFFSACPPEHFPEDWIPLTNVDLVLCQRDELEALSAAQTRALVDWIGLGGRLIVTGCRADTSDQVSLPEQLFGGENTVDQQVGQPAWWQAKEPQQVGFPKAEENYYVAGASGGASDFPGRYFSLARFTPLQLEAPPRSVEKGAVNYFDHLFGRVLCLAPRVPDLDAEGWRRVLAASYGNGRGEQVAAVLGRLNLGGQPVEGFQVTGVGDPPRGLFLALILMFACLAGPIAYTYLYRTRRLSFLLAVVPAISAVATLALLATVVLSDGFRFRAQRFSYTRLDQQTGQAVTLTNQAIFSGLTPGVYQFGTRELGIVKAQKVSGTERNDLRADGSRVSAPEASARTKHQVFSAEARTTSEAVRIQRQVSGGQTEWLVRNELGQPIERLLLRTDDGWYQVQALAAGAEARATSADPVSFSAEVRPWLQRAVVLGNRADTSGRMGSQYGNDWSFGRNPFEQWGLIEYLLPKNDLPQYLQPGEYLAVLEDYPEAGTLAEKVRYQQQVHVIHGQW